MKKYMLALGFKGHKSVDKTHVTVVYLGEKSPEQLEEIVRIVDHEVDKKPLIGRRVYFTQPDMFGPEKDIHVLRPAPGVDASLFRPDLKKALSKYDASAFKGSFKPHVTIDRNAFMGVIDRLVLAQGDNIIKQWDAKVEDRMFSKIAKEVLKGGLADGKPDSKYDKKELKKGMKVEEEHVGKKPKLTKEIAKDHLEEIPDYYTRLEKLEEGFKKSAAIDWFYRNRNKAIETVSNKLGPNYSKEHIGSYVKNLRPWESGKKDNEWSSDIKKLYDKKEYYNDLQKGLKATIPGSVDEKKYLKRHGKDLDARLLDWLRTHATTSEKYKSPKAQEIKNITSRIEGAFNKQARLAFAGSSELMPDLVAGNQKLRGVIDNILSLRVGTPMYREATKAVKNILHNVRKHGRKSSEVKSAIHEAKGLSHLKSRGPRLKPQ